MGLSGTETAKPPQISDADKGLLRLAYRECLWDSRVRLYFDRRLADLRDVEDAILRNPRLADILTETGYTDFAKARTAQQNLLAEKRHRIRTGIANPYAIAQVVTSIALAYIFAFFLLIDGQGEVEGNLLIKLLLYLALVLLGGASTFTGGVYIGDLIWTRNVPYSKLLASIGSFTVGIPAALMAAIWLTDALPDTPTFLVGCWISCLVLGCVGQRPQTTKDTVGILYSATILFDIVHQARILEQARDTWHSRLKEELPPHMSQVITEQLGTEINNLLVEQDTTGLRLARDPAYFVATESERLVERRLRQINGGTVALAGQRGSGKSTLLMRIVERGVSQDTDSNTISVLVPAPTEYQPHEFLGSLFQQVCEKYLQATAHKGYREYNANIMRVVTIRDRFHRVGIVARWMLGLLAPLVLIATGIALFSYDAQINVELGGFWNEIATLAQQTWASMQPAYQIFAALVATAGILALTRSRRWRFPRREATLANKAAQHLYRLRIDQTLNHGLAATVPTTKGGPSLGLTRTRSLSATRFTFPELVNQFRTFLTELAQNEAACDRAVVIGIDEVDRIGTAEQVEKFVRDIKTIFDIENCYFLITVADDVGALFAQRTLSGGSVFDSAFDDVIEVNPLNLHETRDLLQRRAAGLTEPFIWLLFALSGGFPRELLRLARRLVDLNQNAYETYRHNPKIHELTVALVHDEITQVARAVRRRLESLSPDSSWNGVIGRIRPLVQRDLQTRQLRDLTGWLLSKYPPANADDIRSVEIERILGQLGTYLYFTTTILDVFSEAHLVNARPPGNSDDPGSFEYLADARREIGTSPEGSRHMLSRFRVAWRLTDVHRW